MAGVNSSREGITLQSPLRVCLSLIAAAAAADSNCVTSRYHHRAPASVEMPQQHCWRRQLARTVASRTHTAELLAASNTHDRSRNHKMKFVAHVGYCATNRSALTLSQEDKIRLMASS